MVIAPAKDQLSNPSLVESTEDLQSRISMFNSLPPTEREDVVLFSMDATALFPSIEIERTADAVFEVMCEADIKYRNINVLELARYLAVVLKQEEITKYNLEDLVMRRRTNLGRKPLITGQEMNDWWKEEESLWIRPNREPSEEEMKMILALAVSVDVKNIMKKHLF